MSDKTKNILKKIGPWAAFVAIVILLFFAPNFYWLGSSGTWSGRQAICGATSVTGGDSSNLKNTDLEKIAQNPAQWSSGTGLITGNLIYAKAQETFYLRDGIFAIPLDTSNCQGLNVFKNGEPPVAVSGKVMTDNGYEFLAASGIAESVPGWVQSFYNAIAIVGIGINILIVWLIILFFRWFLTLIHIIKPKPAAPAKPDENSKRSVYFGILAPLVWFFSSVAGIAVQVLGLFFAWRGLKTPKRTMAIVGIMLCGAGLFIMTFIFIGLGTTGVMNFFAWNQPATVAGLKPSGHEPLEIAPYISTKFGLSMHPPKGWIASSTPDSPLVFMEPVDGSVGGATYRPELKVGSFPAAAFGATSTAGFVDVFAKSFEQHDKNFSLVGKEYHTQNGGRFAVEYLNVTYTNASGTAVHLLALLALDGSNAYAAGSEIPADRWSKYEQTIRDSLRTFELVPVTYTNAKLHFSIVVPLHWSIDESGANGLVVLLRSPVADPIGNSAFFTNINVAYGPAQYNDVRDVDNTVQQIKNALQQAVQNYTVVEDKAITTSLGQGLHLLGGTFTQNGIKLHNLQAIAAGSNNVYAVTATGLASTWNDYEPTLMAALNSFEAQDCSVRPCAVAGEYVDGAPVNQETWEGVTLHACPVGYAMAGARVDLNKFTCIRVVPSEQEVEVKSVLDGGTRQNLGNGEMHVCPAGMYLRGLHIELDKLLCSSAPSVHLGTSFLDKNGFTQLNDMHACPDRNGQHTVMIGLNVDKNDLACAGR